MLSERVEAKLTGQPAPDGGPMDIVKDIPRTLGREWSKLKYYLPRAIGFLILYWVVPVLGQLMWFLFLAWMMAVQYKDYPFDNHKVSFEQMKNALKERKGLSYSFGITVAIFFNVTASEPGCNASGNLWSYSIVGRPLSTGFQCI